VNSQNQPTDARLWAYVHGQLTETAREGCTQAFARDPALQVQAAALQKLDQELRAAFTRLDEPDDAIAERALAAWEQEHATAVSRTRRLRWTLVATLAAAATLVGIFLPLAPSRAPHWQPPQFQPLLTRGATTEATAQSRPTPATADTCQQSLRQAVTDTCLTQHLIPPRGLVLSMRIQELPQGAFAVLVQARDRHGACLGEWSGDYTSLAAFHRQLPVSAANMAQTLASPSPAP
jgi:hypothetical protein